MLKKELALFSKAVKKKILKETNRIAEIGKLIAKISKLAEPF